MKYDGAGISAVIPVMILAIVLVVWMLTNTANKINQSTATITGANYTAPPKNATPKEAAAHLNADGVDAMKHLNVSMGIAKLEEANKLDPQNISIVSNLGYAYGFLASMASVQGNINGANTYFEKAIPLLERTTDQRRLAEVLASYAVCLKTQGKSDESAKIEERLKNMAGQPSIEALITDSWQKW